MSSEHEKSSTTKSHKCRLEDEVVGAGHEPHNNAISNVPLADSVRHRFLGSLSEKRSIYWIVAGKSLQLMVIEADD